MADRRATEIAGGSADVAKEWRQMEQVKKGRVMWATSSVKGYKFLKN